MNCQLPATGTTAGATLVVAAIIVIAGLVALLVTRRHGARAVVPVVLIVAATLGFAPAPPADAASDCPTTTAPAVTASTTPPTAPTTAPEVTASTTTPTAPSTTVVESPSSSSVTSTIATTTSTTIDPGIASFCGALVPNDGTPIDISIELTGGAGSYTVLTPSTGACDGSPPEPPQSGPVVDTNFFVDPQAYCDSALSGSTAIQAATAGVWTPPIPDTWYACIFFEPPPPPPTPPTTAPPTTSPPVITFCGTLTPDTGGGEVIVLDVFVTIQGGVGTSRVTQPANGDCLGTTLISSGVVVDSDIVGPPQDYCDANVPGSTATNGQASGTWVPAPPPPTWFGCTVPSP